jgi:hypothetical protein
MLSEDMKIKEIIRKHPGARKILKHYDLLSAGCG